MSAGEGFGGNVRSRAAKISQSLADMVDYRRPTWRKLGDEGGFLLVPHSSGMRKEVATPMGVRNSSRKQV
jgi:hypothetical protein